MKERIYKGNIYLCTEYKEKKINDEDVTVCEKILYFDKDKFVRVGRIINKKGAYLLKLRNNIYADIDDIKNLTILLNVLFRPKKQDYIDLIYSFPNKENDLFVRKQELKAIYSDKDKEKDDVILKVK